ncbi:hypothetical protein K3495_g9004 [Podosphaera aphanis]|nr:hypothetical protein K3495_g9004 [Podosphaera aphanis]
MSIASSYDRRNTEPNINDSFNRPEPALRHSYGADKSAHLHQKNDLNELADFLMNQPPPSSNFMAVQQVNSNKRHSNIRQSAMKIFTRYKTKTCPDEPPQLPDSAVCAKTLGGARHIAISIPTDVYMQKILSPKPSPGSQIASTPKFVSPTRHYDHFSTNSYRNSTPSNKFLQAEKQKKVSSAECPWTTDHETHLKLSQRNQQGTATSATRINSLSNFTVIPKYERCDRPGNPRAQSLHSYSSSTHAISTNPPNFQSLKNFNKPIIKTNNFPKRTSSQNCIPINKESLPNFTGEEYSSLPLPSPSPQTPPKDNNKLASTSPLVFGTGTAKLARSFSGAGIEKAHIVRCITPLGLEVKSKSSNLSVSRSTSPLSLPPHVKESPPKVEKSTVLDTPKKVMAQNSKSNLTSVRNSFTHQSVKYRSGFNSPSEMPASPFTNSQGSQLSRQTMGLSHIMTVANLPPDYDTLEKIVSTEMDRKCFRDFRSSLDLSLPTSPDSMPSSVMSDTDESYIAPESSFSRQRCVYSTRSWDSTLRGQQNSHRYKYQSRKSLVPTDQLDLRLTKMERENALLTAALNGILKRFDDLASFESSSMGSKNLALTDLVCKEFYCYGEAQKAEKDEKIIFNDVKY